MRKSQTQNNDMRRNYIPRLRFQLGVSEGQEKALTETERKAHQILSQTKHDSLWGEIISRTMASGSNSKFRRLIDALYSQGLDAPTTIIKVIGEDGWGAVLNCKEGFSS